MVVISAEVHPPLASGHRPTLMTSFERVMVVSVEMPHPRGVTRGCTPSSRSVTCQLAGCLGFDGIGAKSGEHLLAGRDTDHTVAESASSGMQSEEAAGSTAAMAEVLEGEGTREDVGEVHRQDESWGCTMVLATRGSEGQERGPHWVWLYSEAA